MKKYFAFIIALILVNCNKDEEAPPNNNSVIVETIGFEYLDDGGVILKGNLENVEVDLNYGFVISKYEGGTLNKQLETNSKKGILNGDFEAAIKNNLSQDHIYYYNAVAYTSNKYIYGLEKSFFSKGSAKPIINSVQPNIAHISDTITIKGINFSKNNAVYFNNISAISILSNDTLIKCVVPNNFYSDIPFDSIKVIKSTNEETEYNEFQVYAPIIYSIEPNLVYPTDTLTIKGDHFDINPYNNMVAMKVHGNYSRLDIIESSRTELKVKGPGTFYDLKPIIRVKSQNQYFEASNKLNLLLPIITDVPDCISFGKPAKIYGKNFHKNFTLSMGNTRMYYKEVYRDSIVLNINENSLYEDFIINDFTINYLGEEIKFKKEICIDEPWIKVSSIVPLYTHSYNNIKYGVIVNNYNKQVLSKFNPENHNFEEISGKEIPYYIRGASLKKFNRNKLFSYFINLEEGTNFRSFDVNTEEVKKLAPFPGGRRSSGIISCVGDYIYMGLGYTEPSIYYNDIWRYSIIEDKWEHFLDFPEINSIENAKRKPLNFVVDNSIFIGGGELNGYQYDFWQINVKTKVISRKNDLPTAISSGLVATVMNDKVYFDYGVLFEYQASNDEWKIYSGLNKPGFARGTACIFSYNGTLYKVSSSQDIYNNALYKLNSKYIVE